MKPELLAAILSPVFLGSLLGALFFGILGLVQWIRRDILQSSKALGSFCAAITLTMTAGLSVLMNRTGQDMPWDLITVLASVSAVIWALPYVIGAMIRMSEPRSTLR